MTRLPDCRTSLSEFTTVHHETKGLPMLRCLIFGITVLSAGQLLATDYKISNPSDGEQLLAPASVNAGGTFEHTTGAQVELKIRINGSWVTVVDNTAPDTTVGDTWMHTFGNLSAGEYQINLYQIGISTPKDTVEFEVIAMPPPPPP